MRALFFAVLPALWVVGCGPATGGAGTSEAEATGDSADELKSTFTYHCSRLNKQDDGFDVVDYLRVSKSKVVWNQTSDLTASAGAMTAKRDLNYQPKGKIAYARYEYLEMWDKGGSTDHEWKLEPELVTGGMKMNSGGLGGFAIHGEKVDAYGSSKYVCFRVK